MAKSLLIVIVEQLHESSVIDALRKVEVKRFTRVLGTGGGIREKLNRPVDIVKAVLICEIEDSTTSAVFESLVANAKLDVPGRGIAFTMPLECGLLFGMNS